MIENNEYKATVQQWVPKSVWEMPLGSIFTKHKSGYNPDTDEVAIYIKISKTKCLNLITGNRHSIPRLFGWTGTGYPLTIPWQEILTALLNRSQ